MWGLFLLLAIAQGVLLWWLGRVGERLAREEKKELIGPATEADWPRAALIIPAAGSHPRMEEALTSLLEQDYPALLPVVVVNGLIVGWVLNAAYGAPLLLSMCTVALGQAVVCYVLGLPLLHLFRKRIPEKYYK